MSSLLNVSNGSSKPEEFSLNDIEMVVDNKEQSWFKRNHLGKFLELFYTHRSTARLADKDQKILAFLKVEGGCHNATSPREDAQDHDIFISLTCTLYIIVNSRKDKGKALKEHILRDVIPHAFDARIEEIQGKHQQAIEEKVAELAQRVNQIKALEFRDEEHQQKILRLNEEVDDLIANRHVARRGCFHNVLCFSKNNSGEVHPYYVIRCQYRQLEKHKRWLKLRYPNMEVTDECDDPNAIYRWCRFKREVIKKPNYNKNRFSLTEEKRALLETAWMSLFKDKEFL